MNTPRNNPLINADDPKWTAYVLGELEGAERAEIELLLETSDEARALVEELTIATASMKEELSSLLPLMMTPEQRAAIRSAANPPVPKRWFEMFPSKWGLGLAGAAAIVVMAVTLPFVLRDNGVEQVAQVSETPPSIPKSEEKALAEFTVPPQISIVRGGAAAVEQAAGRTADQTKDLKAASSSARKEETATATNRTSEETVAPEQLAKVAVTEPAAPATSTVAPTAAAAPPGTLTGTVVDSAQSLIPGVTITAKNNSTGVTSTTITNETGAYLIPGIAPGTYQVTAALPGFQTQSVTNLSVGPQDLLRLNYTMQVASVNTTVEVAVSANTLIATQGASVGQVLDQQRVADLPLVGNNVLDLIQVMPGTAAATPPPPAPQQQEFDRLQQGQQRQREEQGEALASQLRNAQAQQGQQGQGGQQAAQGQVGGNAGGARGGGGGGGGGGRGGRGGAAAAGGTFAGVRADSSTRDGISVTDNRDPKSTTVNPELVGEIRVVTAPVDAERGRANAQVAAPRPPQVAAPPPPPPAAMTAARAMPAPAPAAADKVATPTFNTEAYSPVTDNPFIRTTQENMATFSIDVDTAAYANVRRFLNQNQLPPRDSVRIEELINYFNYDYAQPTGNAPIAPNMEVAAAPWNPANRLVRIGIKAREVNANRRPPSNLVFLIDVSGSMNTPEKLPLVKAGLGLLVERLAENDSVSMVVYAGNSGLVLPPTSGLYKERIRQAIDNLQAGGSTNGGSGIQLAYNQATSNFIRGGSNRVILMTDGDFNVGITNQGDLTRLIEDRARSGVFLSVLGFGMGNYKDSTLERLADQGNGNYAYIDNLAEARKVLVEEMSGTLITVAKDVKMQVDFNPSKVEAYRLIGYENRVLRTEDFNNDAKDAGDMGAGHTVTALFEVVPKGGEVPGPSVDPSKYTQPPAAAGGAAARANAGSSSNELLTLRVRYKLPDADTSTRMDVPLVDRGTAFARATADFRFAASVAQFGMLLRNSPYKGTSRMDSVLDIAEGSLGADRNGYRKEFITLVQKARNLLR